MAKKRLGTDIRHDQIAEAALDIVRTSGVRALNVAAVAESVGIVPSAVYRHYNNKSEIVSAVIQLIQKRLHANFQCIAELEIGPVEKLKRLLEHHVSLIESNNAIPRLIFSEEVLGGDPQKRQELYGLIQKVLENVAGLIAEGQAGGEIRQDLAAHQMAVSFLGMIQPAAVIWSISNGAFDLAQHRQNAWQLFSDAIRAGSRQPSP